VKILLPIFLATLFSSSALADSICRQITTDDFGPVVFSQPSSGFVITQDCAEDHLQALTSVQLSILVGQQPASAATNSVSRPSVWTVYFGLNLSSLDKNNRDILDKIPPNARVRVSGHTCSIGNEAYNDKLSQRRAEAVANYLQDRGVTITTVTAMGECCPVSSTDLNKNRRVVIEEER
jgi:outer membrane protein OmpA-like peptidoglycan-associated protein